MKDLRTNNYLDLWKYNTVRSKVVLILLFAYSSCNSKTDMNPPKEVETIKAISAARAKAFNEGDAEGIAKYFAEKCYLMAPGSVAKTNPRDVRAYYQSIFDQYHTSLESGYEDVKVDGSLAYGRGFARVKLKHKVTGEESGSTSKYLNILEKQPDGTWVTTHDIWNGNED